MDLSGLSKSQIKNLLEGTLEVLWDNGGRNKKLILEHLNKHGDFKDYPSFILPSGEKRQIKHIKILEAMKPELVSPIGTNSRAHVVKNENHHMVLYESSEERILFEVVSRFDAAMRLSKKVPVVQMNNDKGRFLMSICIGDTLFLPEDQNQGTPDRYVVVNSLWDSGIVIYKDAFNSTKDVERKIGGVLIRNGAEKVTVDPIGRVFSKND